MHYIGNKYSVLIVLTTLLPICLLSNVRAQTVQDKVICRQKSNLLAHSIDTTDSSYARIAIATERERTSVVNVPMMYYTAADSIIIRVRKSIDGYDNGNMRVSYCYIVGPHHIALYMNPMSFSLKCPANDNLFYDIALYFKSRDWYNFVDDGQQPEHYSDNGANDIMNEALRLTDSLIVNGAFSHQHNSVTIVPDTNKTIEVGLYDIFENCIIDKSNLKLKYSTDSLEYDKHYLAISINWYDDDYLKYYGSDYVDVWLYYSVLEPYYCVPSYRRYLWAVMYFVKDGKITNYILREGAE